MGKSIFAQFSDKRILNLIRPYVKRVLGALVFSLLASGATGMIAWLVKPVIDSIFVDKNYGMLVWLPLVVMGLYIIRGVFQMIFNYLMRSAGIKLVRDTRIRLYNRLLHIPVSALGKEASGKVISRLLNDTAVLRALVSDTLLTIFKDFPTIVVLLAVAFYRRWDITLLALVVLPGIIASAHRLGKKVKDKRYKAQEKVATLTHFINEAATGSKVIKVFGNESGLADRFNHMSNSFYRQEVKIVRHKEAAKLFVDASTGIGVALVIWYGGSLVVKGIITSGDLFSSLGAVVMIFNPIKEVGKSYAVFQEIRAAMDRLWWLESIEEEKGGSERLIDFKKEIHYNGISHSYADSQDLVLENIDFKIKKGEAVAIVGPSGAGKTTLIDLLPRFYDPSVGTVEIDGIDIKNVRLTDLRQLFGLVSQDVILFNDTVRNNIAFGTPDAEDDLIKKAAQLAYADEFINELPDGYNTLLGERGLNLSGGQRQRIAMARAILKNPPVLILDEATSALDSVSETLVQKSLEKLMKNKTTIVVAHRLSTIRNADKIIVLEHGKIIAQGNHETLMQRSSVYQELYLSFNASSSKDAG